MKHKIETLISQQEVESCVLELAKKLNKLMPTPTV